MNGTAWLNGIFRVLFGAGIFWISYSLLNVKLYPLTTKMALVVLLSTGASLVALIFSYILIGIMLKVMHKPRATFESIMGDNFIVDALYEMLAIIFNSIAVCAGVLLFLREQTSDFTIFFLYYVGMKFTLRVFAYALAHAIQTHLVAIMTVFCIFMLFLFTAGMTLYMSPPEINQNPFGFIEELPLQREGLRW